MKKEPSDETTPITFERCDFFRRLAQRHGSAFVSFGYTLLCFLCAQLGLIPLVARGYSYLGIVALIVLVVPIAFAMVWRK